MTDTIEISPIRWYGGKGNLAARLLPLIPESRVYCEPYFGAGSIFWRKRPSPVEVVNDLDGNLINMMRAIQDPRRFRRLRLRLAATLYSRSEFCEALRILAEDPDLDARAWAFYVSMNQGFSGVAETVGNWGRVFGSRRGMAETASKWWTRFDALPAWHKRIARAQIDNRDALDVIRYWDSSETTFYIDPPYMAGTRASGSRSVYAHECGDDHHENLVALLLTLYGRVVLSGYDHPTYAPLTTAGWTRIDIETACHAAGKNRTSGLQGKGAALAKVPRTEVVWRSPNIYDGGLWG